MESRGTQSFWGRYLLFVVLTSGIFLANAMFNPSFRRDPPGGEPGKEQQQAARDGEKAEAIEGGANGKDEEGAKETLDAPAVAATSPDEPAEKPAEAPDEPADKLAHAPDEPVKEADERPQAPPPIAPAPRLFTLGSADPASPYRMLVTATNEGAAVARIELNSPAISDLEDRTGYLGHLFRDESGGCQIDVVGPGTPAATAGLKPGDLITAVNGKAVAKFRDLMRQLETTAPGQKVRLTIQGRKQPISVMLGRRPLEVIRPELNMIGRSGTIATRGPEFDPLSFLLTLGQVDDQNLSELLDEDAREGESGRRKSKTVRPRDPDLGLELAGLDLRSGTWNVEDESRFERLVPHDEITFFRELPQFGLKISKTFRLAKRKNGEERGVNGKSYHLELVIQIENLGRESREVAYQLDGPTGLPIEGKWYASKVGRGWGGVGLRDVALAWHGDDPKLISCYKIAADEEFLWGEQEELPGQNEQMLNYIGIDAQYFSAVMMPQKEKEKEKEIWFKRLEPLRVGPVDPDWQKATDTSYRLTSLPNELGPRESLEHRFLVFAGPKEPPLLKEYELGELVYYGWFPYVTVPMLHALHFFHDHLVFNYGLAIVMLTVMVRMCMYPLGRKQALGAQKMQELQPEIKRIAEQYKNNPEQKMRAQQELFRKHNYNPLSGCLVLFIQLPIFFGLYRGLIVDVELRQAPLISESVPWCTNLSAPDMLFDWSGFMPEFVTSGVGFLGLGPYFNLLPILTIVLFLLQQKMFMPPATDDQTRMQQNVMKFMMIFMGFVFFKVAAGLCIYFIMSSLWGLAERKFLPKTAPQKQPAGSATSAQSSAGTTPASQTISTKPVQAKVPRSGANSDAVAKRKKRRKKKRSRGGR